MANPECIAAIKRAAPGIDDATAARIDDAIAGVRGRMGRRLAGADLDADVIAAAQQMGEAELRAAMIEKRNRLINIEKRRVRAGRFAAAQVAGLTPAEAIEAMNVGSQKTFESAGLSVAAQGAAIAKRLVIPVLMRMEELGLARMIGRRDRAFESDVAHEMVRLTGGAADPAVRPSQLATRTAEVLVAADRASMREMNAAGGWISELKGYGWKPTHDMRKIARASADEWIAFVAPRLDERTYAAIDAATIRAEGDVAVARQEWLRGVYNNLVTGNHLKADDASWEKAMAFVGPHNVAKQVSKSRELLWADWRAQYDYNEAFGEGGIVEGVIANLMRDGRKIALMNVWGTNPEAAMEHAIKNFQIALKGADARANAAQVRALDAPGLRHQMDWLTGAANVPASLRGADIVMAIKTFNEITKLGGVFLTSVADLGVKASVLRHNGVSLPEAWGRSLEGQLAALPDGEKREVALLAGTMIRGALGHIYNAIGYGDQFSGRMARIVHMFHKFSLLNWWTDGIEAGVGLGLSRSVAERAGLAHRALPETMRNAMSRFGIGRAEWDVIRTAQKIEADGESFVTPDAIGRLDAEAFRPLAAAAIAQDAKRIAASKAGFAEQAAMLQRATQRRLEDARRDVEIKLMTWYSDTAREAINDAGVKERAMLFRGLRPGDPVRAALDLVLQFKMYPIAFVTQQLGREANRNGRLDGMGLAHLIASTTVLGYVALSLKDVAAGRTPLYPKDTKSTLDVLQASLLQGGGLGVYTDFLFGEYDRYGASPIERLTGPTVSTAGDALRLFATMRENAEAAAGGEKTKDVGGRAARFAVNAIPGNNLFYTRYAFDMLFAWQLYETVSPGYLRRMEREVQKRGRDFILPPSEVIPYGGLRASF